MNIITNNLLDEKKNIKFTCNNLIKENEIKVNMTIHYLSYCNDNIYFKDSNDQTKKYFIKNGYELILDDKFILNMYYASHNMYFFLDKNNKIKSIGRSTYVNR
jgi:hypothetical protein